MSEAGVTHEKSGVWRRVDAVTWALSFIWFGVAILSNVGWSWLLIGLGAIALGGQTALRIYRETTSAFWIACGLALLAGGVWSLLGLTWPLMPTLFILLGVGLLWSALQRRP